MANANNINLLGEEISDIKKSQTFLAAIKDVGLEVNSEKINYLFVSSTEISTKSRCDDFRVNPLKVPQNFKYLGMITTDRAVGTTKLIRNGYLGMFGNIRITIFSFLLCHLGE